MFWRKKDLEEFSIMLEKIINGEEIFLEQKYEDTLESKIRHQFIRLTEKISGNEERIIHERDEIKNLIAEIAHQLRNPLANMEGYLELLSQSCDKEEQKYYIKAITDSEEKIKFLSESFIKMARLENKIIQIKKESRKLNETILNSILQVKKAADKKQINILLNSEEELKIQHDSNWLGEAIYNLLENSVKYSPIKSVIELIVVNNEMYIQICVRDYGIGIQNGEENLIFQRFYRGKNVAGEPGFGLGLYLSREIVQQHGGFIKVKPQNKGFEVSIFLPQE